MIAIKTEELTYTYSAGTPFQKTAIDHVNLEIEQGEFVGVIGHTGSGKSTLIQHFNGLLKPTSGRVLINGTDLWSKETNLREYRFKVGLVFQYPEYQLFEETVYKDIAFGPVNMGLSPAQVDERVREAGQLRRPARLPFAEIALRAFGRAEAPGGDRGGARDEPGHPRARRADRGA